MIVHSFPGALSIPPSFANADGVGGGTDVSAFLQSLIRSLDPLRGGAIEVQFGKYRISNPVIIDRPIILYGRGSYLFDPGSAFISDAGVTPLTIAFNGDTGPNDGGTNTVIRDLAIISAGRNNNSQAANFLIAAGDRITMSAAGDFLNGQIVKLGGCGRRTVLSRITGTVAAGAGVTSWTISHPSGAHGGLRAGMWILITGSWNTPAQILSIVGTTVNMTRAVDAAAGVTNGAVKYCDDHFGKIVSGGGTTTIVLDSIMSAGLGSGDNPNAIVSHGDSGVYIRTASTLSNVSIGGYNGSLVNDYPGCGVLVYGDHSATPPSIANQWNVETLFVYGTWNGIRVAGIDSQAGSCHQATMQSTRGWSAVDMSGFGNNTWSTLSMAGGSGIITYGSPIVDSAAINCYNEGGTYSNYGVGTTVIGGTNSQDAGGFSWVGGVFNRMDVGAVDGALFTQRCRWDPTAYLLSMAGFGGSTNGIRLRYSDVLTDGFSGHLLFEAPDLFRSHCIAIQDSSTALDYGNGQLWFPQGYWMGQTATGVVDGSKARFVDQDNRDPVTRGNLSRVGNSLKYRDTVPGGYAGWACTTAGTPGTHTTYGEIVSHDLLSKSVAGAANVILTADECAHQRIKFTGALTGNITVTVQTPAVLFPAAASPQPNSYTKIFKNSTTGAFTLTIITVAGDPGVAIAQTKSQVIWSDGTNAIAGAAAI